MKHAIENGEGCRVRLSPCKICQKEEICGCIIFFLETNHVIYLQVFGILDVQRVAGNFHISVHGLNIFVAQKVGLLNFE